MDSKLVSAELRIQLRPLLKSVGFARFTDRNAWRHADGRIDVINFQSFNSWLAEGLGCTTYSFAVNLGCAFTSIPRQVPFRLRGGLALPNEWECDLRRGLRKQIDQPEFLRENVWYVDERGRYLMPSVIDVKHVLTDHGLPWFERFADRTEVLRTLLEDADDHAGTWGFGSNPSPMRALLIAYTALDLGQSELAREHLEWLVAQGSPLATEEVRRDLNVLQAA